MGLGDFFFLFLFWAVLCGVWDPGSPTREQTRALGGKSAES